MLGFFNSLDLAPFAGVLVFIVLDIISGLIKAGATGTISSGVMRTGLWHKSALILLEATAYIAGNIACIYSAIPAEIGAVYAVVSAYIVVMELISILENVSIADPEIAGGKLYSMFGVNNMRYNEDDNEW